MLLADQRTHLGVAIERRTKLDALGLFRHGLHKLAVNFLFHQHAATRGANFALIDEHAEKRAVYGSFPISVGKENIR